MNDAKINKKSSVLLIICDPYGYYSGIQQILKQYFNAVECYNTTDQKFKYRSIFQRLYIKCALLFGIDLKTKIRYHKLIDRVRQSNGYDLIIMGRPDVFLDEQLAVFRSKSNRVISYYQDTIAYVPRLKTISSKFDAIFSFDQGDCYQMGYKFLPNFIYPTQPCSDGLIINNQAFSILMDGPRVSILIKLAEVLNAQGVKSDFKVLSEKYKKNKWVDYIYKTLSLSETISIIEESKYFVDIHRDTNTGLSFRIFESLYYQRKLITTNPDIKNYDFYNPQNIWVVDPQNITISKEFLNTPYKPIPLDIYQKYTLGNWVKILIHSSFE